MVESIAKGVMSAGNFSGYPMNDEMVRSCVYKMVEILDGKKFKLYGSRLEPTRDIKTFKGYRLPEMELNENQKLVLLDPEDIHTLVVFSRIHGYEIESEVGIKRFNTTKEIDFDGLFDVLDDFEGEVDFYDFKIRNEEEGYSVKIKGRSRTKYRSIVEVNTFRKKVYSKKLEELDFGESTEINNNIFKKVPLFNSKGGYAYDKDLSFKRGVGESKGGANDPQVKSFSLIKDSNSTINVEYCTTTKVEYNGKRYLERNNVYFDKFGEIESIQKNNAFAYLSKSCSFEGIREIKAHERRKETLDTYQKDEFTDFMANNPQVSHVRMEDDTYDDFLE